MNKLTIKVDNTLSKEFTTHKIDPYDAGMELFDALEEFLSTSSGSDFEATLHLFVDGKELTFKRKASRDIGLFKYELITRGRLTVSVTAKKGGPYEVYKKYMSVNS